MHASYHRRYAHITCRIAGSVRKSVALVGRKNAVIVCFGLIFSGNSRWQLANRCDTYRGTYHRNEPMRCSTRARVGTISKIDESITLAITPMLTHQSGTFEQNSGKWDDAARPSATWRFDRTEKSLDCPGRKSLPPWHHPASSSDRIPWRHIVRSSAVVCAGGSEPVRKDENGFAVAPTAGCSPTQVSMLRTYALQGSL
eukprot:scaffold86172_cov16-Prasinocladus_malaysianus.AAC.1